MNDQDRINKDLQKDHLALEKRIRELEQSDKDRKRLEKALRDSENRFRVIADSTPDWENWIGPDGRLLWLNPPVFEFTGYTMEECMRMADYPMPLIKESDREKMRPLFAGAVEGRTSGRDIECRIVCKGGTMKWVSISWKPMYSDDGSTMGHRASIRDITSRKLVENELLDTKEKLEGIIHALPDIMFRVDREGTIFDCHASEVDRFYLPPASFLGKKFEDVIPKDAARTIKAALDEADKKGTHKGGIYSLPMPKGESWFELSVAKMGSIGCFDHQFIILVRDITDRKRTEDALRKEHDELETRVQERTAELAKAVMELSENEELLESESQRLREANTALKVILEQREADRQELELKVIANVKRLVLPYVEKLNLTPLTSLQEAYLDVINTNLENIISPLLRTLSSVHMDFTPREIEVANLVREGKSAKEIALLLNTSLRSVESHKENIRRKLNLTHKKTNLRTYLLSLTDNKPR